MFKFLTKTKDYALAASARVATQKLIEPYGKMIDLKIDTQKKSLFASLDLKGETQPISIQIDRYEVEEENGRIFIKIDPAKITISREWMQQLLQNNLIPSRHEISQQFSWALKMLA